MDGKEYARKKHIESVRSWQKRHPDKVKAYKRVHYRKKKSRRKDGKEDESR